MENELLKIVFNYGFASFIAFYLLKFLLGRFVRTQDKIVDKLDESETRQKSEHGKLMEKMDKGLDIAKEQIEILKRLNGK